MSDRPGFREYFRTNGGTMVCIGALCPAAAAAAQEGIFALAPIPPGVKLGLRIGTPVVAAAGGVELGRRMARRQHEAQVAYAQGDDPVAQAEEAKAEKKAAKKAKKEEKEAA